VQETFLCDIGISFLSFLVFAYFEPVAARFGLKAALAGTARVAFAGLSDADFVPAGLIGSCPGSRLDPSAEVRQ